MGGVGNYDNQHHQQDIAGFEAHLEGAVYDNKPGAGASAHQNGNLDAFDMSEPHNCNAREDINAQSFRLMSKDNSVSI